MKKVLIIAFACLVLVACACAVFGKATDELHVGVRLTTGEHSKDSSSQTTTITVEQDTIVLERTFTGRRRATSPLRKEFKLSSADKQSLVTLIGANNLLVSDSIELPRKSSNFRYFEISVELTLDGKKGAISISGMRHQSRKTRIGLLGVGKYSNSSPVEVRVTTRSRSSGIQDRVAIREYSYPWRKAVVLSLGYEVSQRLEVLDGVVSVLEKAMLP